MNKIAAKIQETMKGLKFGIEIETVGLSRPAVAAAIQAVLGGSAANVTTGICGHGSTSYIATAQTDGRQWTVVYDGSLPSGGAEVTSPILTYADLELVQSIVRAVRAAGARVDSSCGIHVHVGGERMTARSLRALALLVHNREASIESAVGIAPSRRSRWAQPVPRTFVERIKRPTSDLEKLKTAWYGYSGARPGRSDPSRYHGLNLNSFFYRRTVEFRYFNGSLHAGEVKAYIQFCLALAARSMVCGSVGKLQVSGSLKHVTWTLTQILGLVGDEFATCREHMTKRVRRSRAVERRVAQDTGAPAPTAAPAPLDNDAEVRATALARYGCTCNNCTSSIRSRRANNLPVDPTMGSERSNALMEIQ